MKPESLLLLLLMGGLLLLLFTRSRRQQREAQHLQSGLAPGARVMTTAGLYATVVEIEDGVVVLQTAPGQTSRWDRRAIGRVLPEEPAVGVQDAVEDPIEQGAVDVPIERADEDHDGSTGARTDNGGAAAGSVRPSQEAAPPDRA